MTPAAAKQRISALSIIPSELGIETNRRGQYGHAVIIHFLSPRTAQPPEVLVVNFDVTEFCRVCAPSRTFERAMGTQLQRNQVALATR